MNRIKGNGSTWIVSRLHNTHPINLAYRSHSARHVSQTNTPALVNLD